MDRDGVINRWIRGGYALTARDIVFNEGVIEALRGLDGEQFAIVIASNQSCVGRGLLSAAGLHELMSQFVAETGRGGLDLDAWYCCPHGPEEGCACRKPAPGLLTSAAADLGLDLRHSYFIGDQPSDMEAADRAGAQGLIIRPDNADDVRAHVGRIARKVER
ncbi:MAG TPA: HAD-IIIA family hydrolase [Candidatus Elarobacter sp.]